MPTMTQSKTREIIENFAEEIRRKKEKSAKPSRTVINFRSDMAERTERDIVKVPTDLLRFRKDNGRIASDVLDYEHTYGPLEESDKEAQELLRKFLTVKDPEKTEILKKNILHGGQRDPAIVTCDGFLINGNRRKMVFQMLQDECRDDPKFRYMNVVILPGPGEDGGPPTLLEIEKLENRYQLQSEGKSEYYGFDRALSIRRKIEIGLSLEDQISDDPRFSRSSKKDKEKAIREIEKNYLEPLACVDRYLMQFNRENQYHTISSGIGDKEGRWQAFIDYSNTYKTKFKNSRFLVEHGIDEEEIGEIEEAAFDIIRLRNIPDMDKVHVVMRDLHKYCETKDSRRELTNIAKKVDPILSTEESFEDNEQRKPLGRKDIDAKWATKYIEPITFHLKRASKIYNAKKEKETPLSLLEAAYKKLVHKDMDLGSITTNDYDTARQWLVDIRNTADNLESDLYEQKKKLRRLTKQD